MTEQQIVAIQASQDQAWEELGDYAPVLSRLLIESILTEQREYTIAEQSLITALVSTAISEVVLRKCKKDLEVE